MSVFEHLRRLFGAPDPDAFARRPPGSVVLDVRTPDEYAGGHVDGAINMDVLAPDFRTRAAALDPDGTYYLYCRSGARSGRAATILQSLGVTEAHNAGGFDALVRGGAPVTR